MGKVKFGLSNVHYSKITYGTGGTVTFGTPVAIPGAVSLTAEVAADTNKFYADNGVYATFDSMSGGSIELEVAELPASVYTDLLGYKSVGTTTPDIVETDETITAEFALLFSVDGNEEKIGFTYYRCTMTRPNVSAKTKNDSTEPDTQTVTINYLPITSGSYNVAKSHRVCASASAASTYCSTAPTLPTIV